MTAADADRSTAFHEAGHAIVGLLSGVEVALVAICDDPGVPASGFVTPDPDYARTVSRLTGRGLTPPRPPARNENALGLLAQALAGEIAEARLQGRKYDPISPGGWLDRYDAEYEAAAILHKPVYSPWVRAVLSVIETRTAALVAEHWTWIERTADALLEARRLTGDQVRALRPPRRRGIV